MLNLVPRVRIEMATYISLKQLLTSIQARLRQGYPGSYWVKAEVAGVRRSGNHVYFDLLELEKGTKVAQVRGTAFWGEGTQAITAFEQQTGQKFTDGIKIGARVAVNFHPVYGLSLTLYEIDIELALGGIELQRKETLVKLLRDHPAVIQLRDGQYLTPNKRLPLPLVIQKVALVTSTGSDAYNDFMHCLRANEYGYRFQVEEYHVLVQGYGAQPALIAALSRIKARGGYDAVVITRGGGAPADFLPFDDYTLALQVATFPLPVITGIGHHMNQGICDFFARVHTKTPSIAAQFILDQNHTFEKRILQLSAAIRVFSSQVLVRREKQLESLQRDLREDLKDLILRTSQKVASIQTALTARVSGFLHRYQQQLTVRSSSLALVPLQGVRIEQQRIDHISRQLLNRAPQVLATKTRELAMFQENIRNLSPQRILERGFAVIKKDGQILSSAASIVPGDHLEIIHDGSVLQTEVENKKIYDGREFNL